MEDQEWIHCPICGSKTREKIGEDTVLLNFPLYCPKCKQEIMKVTVVDGTARDFDAHFASKAEAACAKLRRFAVSAHRTCCYAAGTFMNICAAGDGMVTSLIVIKNKKMDVIKESDA